MDREEGELRGPKATLDKKAKQKLERACEVYGWITILPRYQDGTDMSREDFRDDIRWYLDITLQNTPLECDGCSDPFTVEHECLCNRRGLVNLPHNLLNK